jgi:UDP-N-acetylmuramoyl-tripeptide--D-alanyl-D-alanine ligase
MNRTKKIPWRVSEILEATQGKLVCGDIERQFSGVCIDSRSIQADQLFVAIKGEVHDGHNFTGYVTSKGVKGIVIHEDKAGSLSVAGWKKLGVVCVSVKDTVRALGDMASYNRKRSNARLVAITGSNGKTTSKEMCFAVVSEGFNTLGTYGNLNNNIGVPLTLFSLSHEHEMAVVELGMNHAGEIRQLGEICTPDIGIITNIGPAHLEGLGSIENIAKAKAELLENIKPDGVVILNADDPRVCKLADNTESRVVYFGMSEKADIKGADVEQRGTGIDFTLILPEEEIDIKLNAAGKFMVSNALAAASVGYELGLSAKKIKSGLEKFKPVNGRMNILRDSSRKVTIIDDTYNANPGSMTQALKSFESLRGDNRGIFVAGDMFELGEKSASEHERMGRFSVSAGIAKLYPTGRFAENMARGAMDKGLSKSNIFIGTKDDILEDLKKEIKPDDWILVKGSRAMAMEKIVEGLK